MSARALRRGFTVVETTAALVTLTVAGVLVAQLVTWLVNERIRAEQRQAAIEWAVNVLEAARSGSWAEVTPDWAARQRLPAELAARLREPGAAVRVDAVPGRPNLKQVTAEIHWRNTDGTPTSPVALTTRLAARSAEGRP
jgi:type II secretory pathway pseudopilin PulG